MNRFQYHIKGPFGSFFYGLCFFLALFNQNVQAQSQYGEILVLDLQFDAFKEWSKEQEDYNSCYAFAEMKFVEVLIGNSENRRASYMSSYDSLINEKSFSKIPEYQKLQMRMEYSIVLALNQDKWSAGWNAWRTLAGMEDAFESDSMRPVNRFNYGFSQHLLSYLPEGYQKYLRFFGYKVSDSKALNYMEEALIQMNKNSSDYLRSHFLWRMLQLQRNGSIKLADGNDAKHFLDQYVLMQYYGREQNLVQERELLELMISNESRVLCPHLYYLLGRSKVRERKGGCFELKFFIDSTLSDDYIKSAYHYLFLDATVSGDYVASQSYKASCTIAGKTERGDDRWAQFEAEHSLHPKLIEARFYFDSGKIDSSGSILNSMNPMLFSNTYNTIEWNYRMGMIQNSFGNSDLARSYFNQVINCSMSEVPYTVPKSYIHLAELSDDEEQKLAYLEECISFETDYPFKTEIKNEALRKRQWLRISSQE